MEFEVSSVDVWVGEVEHRPGGLSSILAHLMVTAEANLEFVIARPSHKNDGKGVVFLAPLESPEAVSAAADVHLQKSDHMHVLRIAGPDRPGLAAGIAGTLAQAEINIVGLSASGLSGGALVYVRFDSAEDLAAARKVVTDALSQAV